jgi:hypothetical protein
MTGRKNVSEGKAAVEIVATKRENPCAAKWLRTQRQVIRPSNTTAGRGKV